ncbi:hypothetical protein ABIC83_002474 [Roseateles asaccharophilus]|uniref:hypothetical protein n=1 Tax=Roseateles asaccharophilus TaxID=582607 RepID=UPI003839A445
MRIFGVQLRPLSTQDMMMLPFLGAGGAWVGIGIQHLTDGHFEPIVGIAAATVTMAVLAFAGANPDAGRRGVALCLSSGIVAFVIGTALAALQ